MFKAGDKVMALGDNWMAKGSEGVVISGGGSSVKVKWIKPKLKKHARFGLTLYHNPENLLNLEGNDPNISFMLKRRKR